MSLGVLNNLSAVYAENNLNNTNNSLTTVLQQLSSGSKINSGADDAAGLSLVDGLQANSMALTQSQTNASEGVGLLTVADGALSQVTNLLNRAVTLATEASNGTLDSSQDSAANSEYQSILSEINNIGTTTTYNQQAVFGAGSPVNIYTGDSSAAGSSIDSLNIGSLSSSNVGDSGGVMAYSSGQSSVFLNLSTSTQNAQSTDTLNAAGSSTINVNYLVKGADGASTSASTSITVGSGTSYANTASGLINAINNAGLGLSATFSTAAQSGVTGGNTETGIQISGGIISAGVDPSASSTSGTLNPSEITNGDLALGQVITVNSGSTNVATVAVTSTNDTLAQIAAQINAGAGTTNGSSTAGLVTANVITNSATQETSLQLSDAANGGPLTVNVTPGTVVPNALTAGTVVTAANSPVNVVFTSGTAGTTGQYATANLAIPGGSADNNPATANLTGSITLTNGTNTKTFVLGQSSGSVSGNTVNISTANSSLNGLAAAIQANLGATATASTSGIAITSATTGTGITEGGSPTLAATLNATVNSNVAGLTAGSGSDGTTILSMAGDGAGFQADGTDALTGTLVVQNGSGTSFTVTMGSSYAAGAGTLTTGSTTAGGLVAAINQDSANMGMTAAISNGNIVLTSNTVGTTITATPTLAGTTAYTPTSAGPVAPTLNSQGTATVLVKDGAPTSGLGTLTQTGDTLSGDLSITANNHTIDFVMGQSADSVTNSGNTINLSAANSTLSGLISAINGTLDSANLGTAASVLGVTAASTGAAGGTTSGLTLTTGANGASVVTGGTLNQVSDLVMTNPSMGGGSQYATALVALEDGGNLASGGGASDGVLSGTISITSNVGGTAVTDTFTMGNSGTATAAASGTHAYTTAADTMASLLSEINAVGNDGSNGNLDLTATYDSTTNGIVLQSTADIGTDTGISSASSTLQTTLTAAQANTAGTSAAQASITVSNANGGVTSASDVLTNGTTFTVTNTKGVGGASVTDVFTLGNSGTATAASSNPATNAYTTAADTMQSLMAEINAVGGASGNLNVTASLSNGTTGNLVISSNSTTGLGAPQGSISVADTITDAYTSTAAATAGSPVSSATNGSVSINTVAQMSTSGADVLGGSLVLQNGSGTAVTFNLGNSGGVNNGTTVDIASASSTEQGLVSAINAKTALGITASINSSTGALQLQSNSTGTAITATSNLTDATNASALTGGTAGQQNQFSTATISLADSIGAVHNTLANTSNPLTGDISISANGKTIDFIMGGTGASNVSNLTNGSGTVTLTAANSTVSGLVSALTNEGASLNVSVGVTNGTNGLTGDDLLLTSNAANATTITAISNLKDTLGNAAATATLGSFASASDTVTGNVDYSIGGTEKNLGTIAANKDVTQLVNFINTGSYGSATALSSGPDVNGVHASLVSGANGYQTIQLTSDTYGTSGNLTNGGTTGTSLIDHPTAASLTYTASNAYNIGISNVASSGVYDSSIAGETAPASTSSTIAAYANLTTQSTSGRGIATISYSDGAGQSLSATDLSNQTDAQSTLTALNQAITDVAAQDGYIGAQINTLNAVSQVLSTQAENVTAAQNAVQATDYASATSNMSKYEILSQTGISALAQANSMQQEVTKLLQ